MRTNRLLFILLFATILTLIVSNLLLLTWATLSQKNYDHLEEKLVDTEYQVVELQQNSNRLTGIVSQSIYGISFKIPASMEVVEEKFAHSDYGSKLGALVPFWQVNIFGDGYYLYFKIWSQERWDYLIDETEIIVPDGDVFELHDISPTVFESIGTYGLNRPIVMYKHPGSQFYLEVGLTYRDQDIPEDVQLLFDSVMFAGHDGRIKLGQTVSFGEVEIDIPHASTLWGPMGSGGYVVGDLHFLILDGPVTQYVSNPDILREFFVEGTLTTYTTPLRIDQNDYVHDRMCYTRVKSETEKVSECNHFLYIPLNSNRSLQVSVSDNTDNLKLSQLNRAILGSLRVVKNN